MAITLFSPAVFNGGDPADALLSEAGRIRAAMDTMAGRGNEQARANAKALDTFEKSVRLSAAKANTKGSSFGNGK